MKRVLLVDPDEAFGHVLEEVLGDAGYSIRQVATPQAAVWDTRHRETDVILLNLDPAKDGGQEQRQLLHRASDLPDAPPVIGFGWGKHSEAVLELFQDGVTDFIEQPLDIQELRFAINRACRRAELTRELAAAQRILTNNRVEGLLGNSKSMVRVHEIIQKVAAVFTTVLITGESGTGKEVVANAIHRMSPRANKPFVAFSVCSFPDTLIDDELFGHERGAFTGANQSRRGRFEEANGGTIFIDEIGDLALPLQAKLLRALQERTVERLGSNVPRPIDVRVLCATNRNLEQMVREGTFREDLYFRISVVKVHMPPLRERAEDIPLLAEYFLRSFAKLHKKQHRNMTPGFLSALSRHGWPGNVRELQNVIERSLVLANGHDRLGVDDLPPELQGLSISDELPTGSFHEAVRGFKKEIVRSALAKHGGNKLKAAKDLGISRCYLHRLLNQLDVAGSAGEEAELQEEVEIEAEEETPAAPARAVRAAARIA
ncbi:MAG TPA: sigma-54 dependent transcriptional regulator [Terriglobales bacterium]|nr:sigma-54 dependent transcriptional regulator [Terriglobales bacterium]